MQHYLVSRKEDVLMTFQKSSRLLDMGFSKSQSVNQGSSSKSVTVDPSLTSFFIIASQIEEDGVCIKFFSFSFRKVYPY